MKSGWLRKKLGDIAEVQSGGTPLVSHKPNWGGDIPWYSSGELNDDYTTESERSISSQGLANSNAKLFPKGSLLIGMYDTAALKMSILDRDAAFNQAIAGVKPTADVDLLFVLRAITNVKPMLLSQRRGVRQKNLSLAKIKDVEIPVPPLAEQQRIVGILDEAFEGIATAKANAEKNLQNARALFESRLQSVFTQRGEGWVEKRLVDVCYVDRGSSPRPIKKYFTDAADGVNWIKIGDATEGEKFITSTAQKITREGAKESVFVKEGDFLLTNSMSFGRAYIMKTQGYIHDGWFCLRLNETIDTDYFYYLLTSPYVRDQFNRLAAGAIVLNISSELVKKAVLPIPPIETQRQIAVALEAYSDETQRLATIYERKLAALDELKKSLLHQAFLGEL